MHLNVARTKIETSIVSVWYSGDKLRNWLTISAYLIMFLPCLNIIQKFITPRLQSVLILVRVSWSAQCLSNSVYGKEPGVLFCFVFFSIGCRSDFCYKEMLWQCKIAAKFLAYAHSRYLSPISRAGSEPHSQCPQPTPQGQNGCGAGRKKAKAGCSRPCEIFAAGKFSIGSMSVSEQFWKKDEIVGDLSSCQSVINWVVY